MTTVLKYATIRESKIVAINEAFPPHELKSNQFELTNSEFTLLKAITPSNKEDVLDVINSILFCLVEKVEKVNGKS